MTRLLAGALMGLALLAGDAGAVSYPRHDRVRVEAEVTVRLQSGNVFKYTMTIRSLPESWQRAYEVGVDVPVPTGLTADMVRITTTQGMVRVATSRGREMRWDFGHPGYKGTSWLTWSGGSATIVNDEGLFPGESVAGLIYTSAGLPGIRPMIASGWVEPEDMPDIEDLPGEDAVTGTLPVDNPD